MGNCDQKAFVDDSIAQRQFSPSGDTPTTDTMEKDPNEELDNMMSRPFAFKKEKSAVDPLCTYIRNAIPKAILSIETAKFTNKYRIKKNIKCEDNILYQVNIVEQKSTGAFFLAKMITLSDEFSSKTASEKSLACLILAFDLLRSESPIELNAVVFLNQWITFLISSSPYSRTVTDTYHDIKAMYTNFERIRQENVEQWNINKDFGNTFE